MSKVIVISVVRDIAMYKNCVADNSHLAGCERVILDNRKENKGIPTQYNAFIDQYDYAQPAWFIFCHEDFEFLTEPKSFLPALSENSIYGVAGARTQRRFCGLYWQSELIGGIQQRNKDGSNLHIKGRAIDSPTEVETIDCQCIIVHSSLIKKNRLRFDEQLRFDLYAEDFCVAAKEKCGIKSIIFPVTCCHWSSGTIGSRYFETEKYISKKYPRSCYAAPAFFAIGGGGPLLRRLQLALDRKGVTSRLIAFARQHGLPLIATTPQLRR